MRMTISYELAQTGKLTDRFFLVDGLPKGIKPVKYAKPTELLPVVIAIDGKPTVMRMKWGFYTQGAKNANSVFRYKTHTVRSEDVFKKAMFAKAVRSQRCLVPVDAFYEEVETKSGKKTFRITHENDKLFVLAGIHSTWGDPDGKRWHMFSIVSTTANKDMRTITNRMPVILKSDMEAQWLDPNVSDMNSLYDMMRPYTPGLLHIKEV